MVDLWIATHHHQRSGARARHQGRRQSCERNNLLGRIHFAHCRNIKRSGKHSFEETAHPSEQGDIDVHAVLSALHDTGFAGPIRSDHGRMIWGETGQPGYGLHDRALGAMYLHGLWEGITATATDMLPVPR